MWTRRMRAYGFASLVVLAGGTLPTVAAVVYRTVAEVASESGKIVSGDVVEVTSFWSDDGTEILSQVTVYVDQYLYGGGSGVEVFRVRGGTVGDITSFNNVWPSFEAGDHVLLCLRPSGRSLVAAFQGAYLTDGRFVARTAAGLGRVIPSSLQPLTDFLRELQQGLPPGVTLPPLRPYAGSFQIPAARERFDPVGPSWRHQENPMTEDYLVNPNCVDSSAGNESSQIGQIRNGADTWNATSADFAFHYGGQVPFAYFGYDEINLIFFSLSPPADDDGRGDYLALTQWIAVGDEVWECDVVFNDLDYTWWNGVGTCPSGAHDIWSVATHEFGHWLVLGDLYDPSESSYTMYHAISSCDTSARSLEADDVNGIVYLYGIDGATWVDFDHWGFEFGSYPYPYNTLAEGVTNVPSGGTIMVKAGSTSETPTITKALTLRAFRGTVIVGQ